MSIKTFLRAEEGAVTVDWVVLTAALVSLGLAVTAVIFQGISSQTGDVNEQLVRNDIICNTFCDRFATYEAPE